VAKVVAPQKAALATAEAEFEQLMVSLNSFRSAVGVDYFVDLGNF
jgi:hypothetical protein